MSSFNSSTTLIVVTTRSVRLTLPPLFARNGNVIRASLESGELEARSVLLRSTGKRTIHLD